MSEGYFSISSLTELFDSKIKRKNFKGIDKIRPSQFEKDKLEEINRIVTRYDNYTYKFTPYLEILKNKGRNKYPRLISSPTVRDKLLLTALKEYLHKKFPEQVPNKLANCVVRDLRDKIKSGKYKYYYRTDIKSFYDNINRKILLKFLRCHISDPKTLKILVDSIENVTISKNESKLNGDKYYSKRGIPQGLPISNILAEIYLKNIDRYFHRSQKCYYRFRDDFIILSKAKPIIQILILKIMLKLLNLKLNSSKSKIGRVNEKFSFLGYMFSGAKLTLSERQISKFISRISGKFTWFRRGIENPESRPDWLVKNTDLFKECFINELNEQITGAKSEKKRYGWLVYFIEIDDLSLLFRINNIIRNFFVNLDDFENKPPQELKSIVKAYFDIKYKNGNNYIHNYSTYQTINQKRQFLIGRGKINPDGTYSKQQIERIFEKYKNKRISMLEKDIGYY